MSVPTLASELCLSSRRAGAFACLLALAACGGGGGDPPEPAASGGAWLGSREVVTALINDDGSASPSEAGAVPADRAARTLNGRYASARQAEQLEGALGDASIAVDAECCGLEGVERTVGLVHALQAARDLPNGVPVLVRSADARLAATVVNRLIDAGYRNVWLVTP
jgi:hypothetical protein